LRGRALALALALAPAAAQAQASRGPIEARDEYLLSQSVLSLPPLPAAVLAGGRSELRVDGEWGNDFGIHDAPAGEPDGRLFFVDGEHRTAALTARHGFGRGWAAGVRVPVHWRGGGSLDPLIDRFHEVFGFPDSGRPRYPRNRLRVDGLTPEGEAIGWTGGSGTGLGSVEAEVVKSLRSGALGGPAIALAARVQVPTGGEWGDAAGAGAQALVSQPLGRSFDVHGGVGVSVLAPAERNGIDYEGHRAQGFVTFEWRPVAAWSALVQWEANGTLATGIDQFPGPQLSLRIASKVDLGRRWRIEGGFIEGIKSLENTSDFGVFAALQRRIGG